MKRYWFLIAGVVTVALIIFFATTYKSDEQIAVDAVNNLMQTNLFNKDEFLFVEKTYSDEHNYGFAAELKVDDDKLNKFLKDFVDEDYKVFEDILPSYQETAQEMVPVKTFSKDISKADEVYWDIYPIYSDTELPKHRINKTAGHRNTYAFVYVFKGKGTNHICIQIVC